mmetsp:Transcript_44192/g.104619  ORF Transcript_44192/g.104619 Transcript_44192/m.104619 type:complete len:658 (+) Transcript_44192:209-2182(+)|eukprot:CAMPEP_0178447026 /NCGR_PEP_ID=MMETSP0689_2-20121128/41150_1 /TAXON_ID=160604 /ORGANISM="Amphidinium massartii, Strain CS-259" /LENGTH=657 /DNA_ID=CAMNT_0020071955 /DNA_START=109 /DNA_END=2082 /DNA_ORIENTATION=-
MLLKQLLKLICVVAGVLFCEHVLGMGRMIGAPESWKHWSLGQPSYIVPEDGGMEQKTPSDQQAIQNQAALQSQNQEGVAPAGQLAGRIEAVPWWRQTEIALADEPGEPAELIQTSSWSVDDETMAQAVAQGQISDQSSSTSPPHEASPKPTHQESQGGQISDQSSSRSTTAATPQQTNPKPATAASGPGTPPKSTVTAKPNTVDLAKRAARFKAAIVSASFGGRGTVLSLPPVPPKVKCVLYTDVPIRQSLKHGWQVIGRPYHAQVEERWPWHYANGPLSWGNISKRQFLNSSLAARFYKMSLHLLPEIEGIPYVMWTDADALYGWHNSSMLFQRIPALLGSSDMAVESHPLRNKVIDEIPRAIRRFMQGLGHGVPSYFNDKFYDGRTDFQEPLQSIVSEFRQQHEHQLAEGFRDDVGLFQTTQFILNMTSRWKVGPSFRLWFLEAQLYTIRDQLSLPYVAWKKRLGVKTLKPDTLGHLLHTGDSAFTTYADVRFKDILRARKKSKLDMKKEERFQKRHSMRDAAKRKKAEAKNLRNGHVAGGVNASNVSDDTWEQEDDDDQDDDDDEELVPARTVNPWNQAALELLLLKKDASVSVYKYVKELLKAPPNATRAEKMTLRLQKRQAIRAATRRKKLMRREAMRINATMRLNASGYVS